MRPLYRWKSFWLGCLVLVFLAWAWWDSHRYYSSAVWLGHGFAWHGAGMVGWSQMKMAANGPFDIATTRMPLAEFWMPGVFAKFPTTAVSHWLIVSCFLTLWATFLAWRWRRMKRLTEIPQ